MEKSGSILKNSASRRRFLQNGMIAAGAATVGTGLLPGSLSAFAQGDDSGGKLSRGDASILRFLAAAEILESDLWEQYWELSSAAGIAHRGDFASKINPSTGKAPVGTGGNLPYTTALQLLDGPHFRTLPGSTATGSANKGRLTNLTKLTVDTSFWSRYRSDSANPDLGDTGFVQAVPSLNVGQHTAIPRTNDDASNPDLIKAIAFTAGFHFAFIEQGGTSLYPGLAQRVSDPEVLRVVLSIGPSEALHFQVWHDKAGNANAGNPPLTVVDPINNNSTVTFVDLTVPTGNDAVDELIAANLIMPEPCPFLNRSFPGCSIVRPTETKGAAIGLV